MNVFVFKLYFFLLNPTFSLSFTAPVVFALSASTGVAGNRVLIVIK